MCVGEREREEKGESEKEKAKGRGREQGRERGRERGGEKASMFVCERDTKKIKDSKCICVKEGTRESLAREWT